MCVSSFETANFLIKDDFSQKITQKSFKHRNTFSVQFTVSLSLISYENCRAFVRTSTQSNWSPFWTKSRNSYGCNKHTNVMTIWIKYFSFSIENVNSFEDIRRKSIILELFYVKEGWYADLTAKFLYRSMEKIELNFRLFSIVSKGHLLIKMKPNK